jgi:hypothetical protein
MVLYALASRPCVDVTQSVPGYVLPITSVTAVLRLAKPELTVACKITGLEAPQERIQN